MKTKARILLALASPSDEPRVRVDIEARTIQDRLKLGKKRGSTIVSRVLVAARIEDVRMALLEDKPNIVHFSGHGTHAGQLVFENAHGESETVPPHALAELLSICGTVQCVILNACYSIKQGELMLPSIPFAIVMDGSISDDAAIAFAAGFYDAVGAGENYETAFKYGRNNIGLKDLPEEQLPVLLKRA